MMLRTMLQDKIQSLKDIEVLLAEVDELPTVPETLIKILKIVDDPDAEAGQLSDVIERDQPLMAKILRLANSPYYSGAGNLISIKECVSILGFKMVRQVAICVSVATTLVANGGDKRYRIDFREIWKHSIVTATIVKTLATMTGQRNAEDIFIGGLLHDIGKFVLTISDSAKYEQVIIARSKNQFPLTTVEQEELGYDHCEMGAVFAATWRFPEQLIGSCLFHHCLPDDIPADLDESTRTMATMVGLADYIAYSIEPPASDLGFCPDPDYMDAACEAIGLTGSDIEDNVDLMRENITNVSAFLDLA